MCGIVGFSGLNDTKILKAMNQALFHRGPDDEGYYSNGLINLGMRRLSIVDLESGKQPICNEDGLIWVVCNGEIYNHVLLRRDLEEEGHHFSTDHSDTEVIVHLYEEYGEDWPTHVNGMFGAAVWDERNKKLSLYRDRIGKKPLYYSQKDGRIIFASEIKAILQHPAISRELDYQSLYHYFGLKNISAPGTAFADIKQLMPGHVLVWEAGRIKTYPYWSIDFGEPLNDITEEEAAEHLFGLFRDAVKVRMDCDVPYGAYLSGGVDSSAVVSMMSREQSNPVITFCLGYEDKAEGQFLGKEQDIDYARHMSQILGTDHYEYIINAEQFAEQMPSIMSAFDEPFSGVVSTYFLSILIKRYVKVALSGDGADELYGSYLAHRLAFPIQNYLIIKSRGINNWSDLGEDDREAVRPFDSPEEFRFLAAVASRNIAKWRERLSVFSFGERNQLLAMEILHAADFRNIKSVYENIASKMTAKDILNQSLEIDQRELLPNQVLPFVDRLSMAHSIEVRVPYLDYRIIEFANRLPGNFKIRKEIVKHIHKKALQGLLPDDLIHRPKEGFVQPIYPWMHGALKSWVKERLDSLPGEIFNQSYIKKLNSEFQNGNQDLNAKIWNLVCFGLWFEGVCGQ
jgi:asparagine synthase (glutamine-hydrolysing)